MHRNDYRNVSRLLSRAMEKSRNNLCEQQRLRRICASSVSSESMLFAHVSGRRLGISSHRTRHMALLSGRAYALKDGFDEQNDKQPFTLDAAPLFIITSCHELFVYIYQTRRDSLSHVSQVDPAHTVKLPTVAQFSHAVCHVVPLTPSCTIIVVRGKTSSNCHALYRGTV